MKTKLLLKTLKAAALTAAVAISNTAAAQAGGYTLDWFCIGGGGGTIDGDAHTLSGTVGQPDAGSLAGDGFALEGGFWAGVLSAPTLSIAQVGSEAVLSWTGSGFVLQSTDDVIRPWADFSPGFTTDGLRYRINSMVAGHKKFFQLRAGQCIDFQTMPPMGLSAPWSFQGATFQTFDFNSMASSPRIQARSGPAGLVTGLDCDHRLEIDLPGPCNSVMLVLASSAHPATVTARNATGAVTATATMTLAGQLAPETLRLQGPGITQIVIDAPAQEALLLQLCCGL